MCEFREVSLLSDPRTAKNWQHRYMRNCSGSEDKLPKTRRSLGLASAHNDNNGADDVDVLFQRALKAYMKAGRYGSLAHVSEMFKEVVLPHLVDELAVCALQAERQGLIVDGEYGRKSEWKETLWKEREVWVIRLKVFRGQRLTIRHGSIFFWCL